MVHTFPNNELTNNEYLFCRLVRADAKRHFIGLVSGFKFVQFQNRIGPFLRSEDVRINLVLNGIIERLAFF